MESLSRASDRNEVKHASNFRAWAIGKRRRNGFTVRRIVWGKLMASYERRDDEEIRAAVITVSEKISRPIKTAKAAEKFFSSRRLTAAQ